MASNRKRRAAPAQLLPASLEAAWGVREPAVKGPKRGLSLVRIVNAATAIASAEGLAAVSMSRVADTLGASTMSLYRYVGAKEELLALMVDHAFRTPPPAGDGEGWRKALARWAHGQLAVLREHSWIVRIPISGPPITPNQVVWFERGLGCLAATSLLEAEKLAVLLLVNGFVRNDAMLAADLIAAARAAGSTLEQATTAYGRLMSTLIDADRFPAISELIASGVFEHPGKQTDFDFGLERILDGVEALVTARASDRRQKRAPRRVRGS